MQETDEPPEDDLSIRAHLLALQRECGKSAPSDTVMKEKLEKTTSHRAEMVRSQPVDVLKAYPCLRQEKWVSITLVVLLLQYYFPCSLMFFIRHLSRIFQFHGLNNS